jgi:hypothetical protein
MTVVLLTSCHWPVVNDSSFQVVRAFEVIIMQVMYKIDILFADNIPSFLCTKPNHQNPIWEIYFSMHIYFIFEAIVQISIEFGITSVTGSAKRPQFVFL